ncbi:MAG: hypothetical protein Q9182_002578 [Xanthomendoza sp. 2 TL-2023]
MHPSPLSESTISTNISVLEGGIFDNLTPTSPDTQGIPINTVTAAISSDTVIINGRLYSNFPSSPNFQAESPSRALGGAASLPIKSNILRQSTGSIAVSCCYTF